VGRKHVTEHQPGLVGVSANVESAVAGEPEDHCGVNQAQEHDRGGVRRKVRSDTPVLLTLAYDSGDFSQIALDDAVDALPPGGVSVKNFLRQDDPRNGHVGLEQLEMSVQQAVKTVRGVGRVLAGGVNVLLKAVRNEVENRVEDRIFAGVMAIDR